MQFKNYLKAQNPAVALLAIALVFTSCGSYQYAGEDNDGVYGTTETPVEYTEDVAQTRDNNGSYYENYFKEKSIEFNQENEIFTDIDAYEGEYAEQSPNQNEEQYYAGWGQNNDDVTVNIYSGFSGYNFYNPWWYRPYRYGYGYSPYWSLGWGYSGFYDPFWCPPYYGGFYGGYSFYGYNGYPYNYGYNNFYGRRGVAYNRTRRGSSTLSRANALGRRTAITSRYGNTRSRVSTRPRRSSVSTQPTRTRVRTNNSTSTPRTRIRTTKPRSNNTYSTPRTRRSSNMSSSPRRSSSSISRSSSGSRSSMGSSRGGSRRR